MTDAAPHTALLPPDARPRSAREVTHERLQLAYERAALIVAEYGDQYLPVFERIERELNAYDATAAARQRALAVARRPMIEAPKLMIEHRRDQ